MSTKEKRGIYNVTFNDKKATQINLEIDVIEKKVTNSIIAYAKGFQNFRINKGMGAKHINLHLEPESKGFISINELLNLGNSLRKYMNMFKQPFLIQENRKAFEWENNEKVRFRCIVVNQRGGSKLPLSLSDDIIITFYSDRNIKERMKFKNHEVAKFYENKEELKNKEIQDFKNKLKQIIEKQNNKKDRDMER